MDVILRDQATVVIRPCAFNRMTEYVSGSSLSVVSFFPGLILFALVMILGPVPASASQIVPPIPTSDWEYRYVRCNTWQGPFKNEIDAAITGLNNIYGACGDQIISDWGRWGTLQEGVRGPCGSTKYHPSSTWDFKDGIEVYNNRRLKASYCNGNLDGYTVDRRRTASCPGGYSYNGYTCTLTGTNLLKSAGPMCPLVGNPVYPGTGNKYQREVDQKSDTSGSIGFIRHYNSRLVYSSKNYTINTGANWSNTYTRQVTRFVHRGISLATVVRPDGRAFNYVLDAANLVWVPDEDVKGNLEELKDSQGVRTGWRYKTPGDVAELYDANGRLLSITDLQGRTQTLTYADQDPNEPIPLTQSYPTRIDSNTGEYLLFAYSPHRLAHRLVSMEDQAGRSWGYRYDSSGNLEFVDNPDQTTRQYHYEDANNPNALTGITDERGTRYATFEYKSGAQVTASYHGPKTAILTDRIDGVSIVYNASGTRTLTNSNGQASIYATELQNGVRLVTDVSGPGCATCGAGNTRYDYDSVNNNLLSKTENGVTTRYGNYDAAGNYQCKVEAVSSQDTGSAGCTFDPVLSPGARRTDYTYDSRYFSKILTITEPSVYPGRSKVTSYSYDNHGNRISETVAGYTPDGAGISRTTSMAFSGPLKQLGQIDGARTDVSDITYFRYYENDASEGNNRARLKEIEDAAGILVRSDIQYTSTGKPASDLRPNGVRVSYNYYVGNDRMESLTVEGSTGTNTTRWTYLQSGEVSSVTTAADTSDATTITFGYDDARRLTRVTDGHGNYIEYDLDTEGNRLSENIYDGNANLVKALSRTFDAYNRLDVVNQANEVTDYRFSPNGTLAEEIDGNGTVNDYSYDDLKRLLAATLDRGGLGAVIQYKYDVADNLVSVVDPVNGTTVSAYDDLGNMLRSTSPDAGTANYTYDEAGNRISKVDAEGNMHLYSYDNLNRLEAVDAPGTEDDISYVYDNCQQGIGRLCSAQLGDTSVNYSYDSFGNVTTHQQLTYSHDAAGRVRTVTYPSGAVVVYSYDVAGGVNKVDIETVEGVSTLASDVSYQPFGPVSSYLLGNGLVQTQGHDLAYRLTGQTVPGVLDVEYPFYDANGNMKTRTDAHSGSSAFSYDALDRLIAGEGSFGVREYDYDLNGNRLRLDDGAITDYNYSVETNRLLSETGWLYTTDENGSVTGKVNSVDEGSIYKYNSYNRLIMASDRTVTPAKGKNKQPVVEDTVVGTYTYNALGQRASKDAGGVTTKFLYGMEGALLAEIDVAGMPRREYIYLNSELLAVLDHKAFSPAEPVDIIVDNVPMTPGWIVNTSNKDYGSDYLYSEGGSGNTVRWVPTLEAGDYEVYVWYVKSRKYSDSVPYTMFHDGQSETVTVDQSTGGGSWLLVGNYYFDGDGSEYIEVSDATGKTTADAARFVKLGGGPVSMVTTLSYVHNDHLGTPQVMTDETGNEIWRAIYDPFGKATIDDASTVDMNVRFPGQYFDSETGCHYNYFRYYCPDIGRYLTADPIGLVGGLNLYSYVGNNPTYWVDPLGLDPFLVGRPLQGMTGNYAGHMFVVSGASYLGDPNAAVYSYGRSNASKRHGRNIVSGLTGRVDSSTAGFSDTTNAADIQYWKSLGSSSCSVQNSSASPIPASDSDVDYWASRVNPTIKYLLPIPLAGRSDAVNSNSAAQAVANRAASTSVARPQGPQFGYPGAKQWTRIEFR